VHSAKGHFFMRRIHHVLLSTAATVVLTSSTLVAAGASADAAALTPWTNYYDNHAKVAGVAYTVHFTGAGKHVYKNVDYQGCSLHLAKQYVVTVYKDSNPSRVLYRSVMDGLHYLYATDGNPWDSGTRTFRSVRSLLKPLKSRLAASDTVAAWRSGGKQLAQYRTSALANDLGDAEDQLNTYAVHEAKKIAAAQPIDPETGEHDAGEYYDSIVLDGYDVAAHMKSTKRRYGTGCRSENGQAQFERKITVSGTMGNHTLLETDATDGVTIGLDRVLAPGQKWHYFRLVNGQRQYFQTAMKAAYVFK
jgi:hypothetical protein